MLLFFLIYFYTIQHTLLCLVLSKLLLFIKLVISKHPYNFILLRRIFQIWMRSRFLLFIWHYFKQLRARREGFGGKTAGITTLLRDTSLHDLCHFWHNIFKNRSRFCASSSKTNEGCVCLCETAARQIYFFVLFSKKAFIRVWWIKLGKCCLVTYSGEGTNATDDKLVFG